VKLPTPVLTVGLLGAIFLCVAVYNFFVVHRSDWFGVAAGSAFVAIAPVSISEKIGHVVASNCKHSGCRPQQPTKLIESTESILCRIPTVHDHLPSMRAGRRGPSSSISSAL
jgi:hypothetical protein